MDKIQDAVDESQRLEDAAQRREKAKANYENNSGYKTAIAKLDTMKAGVTGKNEGDLTSDKYDELVKVGSQVLEDIDLTNSTGYVKKALRTSLEVQKIISDKNHVTPGQYENLDKYGIVDTLIDASRIKKGEYENDKSDNLLKKTDPKIDVIDMH